MRTKFKVWLTMLVLFIGAISFSSRQQVKAAASNITIDGDVSDWASVPKVTASKGAQLAMTVDNNYLYWYVSVKPDGAPFTDGTTPEFSVWEPFNLQVGSQSFSLSPKPAANGSYQFPQKPGTKVAVDIQIDGTSGHSNVADNGGYVTAVAANNQYKYNDVFEGKVALSDLELTAGRLKFTLSGGPHNVGSFTASTTFDYSNQSGGGDYTGHPNIVIDGAFDDWSDVQKTKLRFSDGDYNAHNAALLQYDGNLYLYINMDPHRGASYNDFQPTTYNFKIGTQSYDVKIVKANGQPYQQLKQIGDTERVAMAHNVGEINVLTGSEGYVTRMETSTGGRTDVMEIKVPVKSFGGAADDGQTITMTNVALGNQTLTVTGGSTGPILLAAGGFGIALFGIWQFNRRKKRAEELTL
ncbi:Firmicu-CTERM sorting domain-containing protein [Lapidilactobacillus gannanensis]|uniref:Firmicu-CTERM sorting domain-containing protein n=1 Tax=Lapidilactobacillus gannanensis TaxID=2486002 RepID=A0ABW4BLJ9_9LACO|nr:Firmicu-CTERM sorting domain-containing protein [Lapidilactobacillus gannanensis]MCH4057248.1 Firmicu-CTERM sorting domain-containing protein [Lactobacillaceae bacterium]